MAKQKIDFGTALAKVMEDNDLRQDVLAERAGVRTSYLSHVKHGRSGAVKGVCFEKVRSIIEGLPKKAKIELYLALFEWDEVLVSTEGQCRKKGTGRKQSHIEEVIDEMEFGEAIVIRKTKHRTPSSR
jgi:transcriptional regulator with XRE-family HTH domain